MYSRKSVTPHYYRGASAVVLVYDVTNPGSLMALDHWIDELHHHGLGPKVRYDRFSDIAILQSWEVWNFYSLPPLVFLDLHLYLGNECCNQFM